MHSNERATNKCWLCGSSFINRWFRGLGWIIQTMAFRCIYLVSWIRRVLNSNAYMYFMTLARFSVANYFQFDFQLLCFEFCIVHFEEICPFSVWTKVGNTADVVILRRQIGPLLLCLFFMHKCTYFVVYTIAQVRMFKNNYPDEWK